MPELPEVEFGRTLAQETLVGRTIERARCADDSIVFAGVSPRRLARSLRGRTVAAARRHGKYIWLELDRRPWPLFHFGMTGSFRVPEARPIPLESSPKGGEALWPPRFVKVHLWLDDGGQLVMTNARRLGRIRLLEDPASEPPVANLGFDPLLEMPSPTQLTSLLRGRRVTLKGLLLDQSFAAGVGNWIADEVLYQARLDPRRMAYDLSPADVRRLHSRLRHVIQRAVAVNADKRRFPRTWLFHHRWGKDASATTARGERIEHIRVAGRTTAWVPERQG